MCSATSRTSLSNMGKRPDKKRVPTGLILFDQMVGGGLPRGCRIEIFGEEDCGKTTLALEISRAYKKPYYMEFEQKFDDEYAQSINPTIGTEFKNMVQPFTIEEGVDDFIKKFRAIETANIKIRKENNKLKKGAKKKALKGQYDLLVMDTVGSAVTIDQIEKDMQDNDQVASLAIQMTRFLRSKAEKILSPKGCTLIMLNHKKEVIGSGFGDGDRTPGGRHVKFTSIARFSITRKKTTIYDDAIDMGIWFRKNHINSKASIKKCRYLIKRGHGVVRGYETLQLGLMTKTIKEDGQFFVLGDYRMRGVKQMVEFLEANPNLRSAINEEYLTSQN